MTINNEFKIEEMVYLKTDPEQLPRIITGIIVRKNALSYYVSSGIIESVHYNFELSTEKTLII